MDHGTYVLLFAIGLFLGMLILLEVGRRIGVHRLAKDPQGAEAGVGTVEGAVFALLGLLIAFTFSGAATRFDSKDVMDSSAAAREICRVDVAHRLPTLQCDRPMIAEALMR